MMDRFRRSWVLFQSSVSVIFQNKKLLVFPILTCCFTVLIILFFLVPIAFQSTGHSVSEAAHWKIVSERVLGTSFTATQTGNNGYHQSSQVHPNPVFYVITVAMYFLSMFSATFCNVAFFSEIMQALKGNDVSISRGLSFACKRLGAILMWSAFAGLVGLIIQTLEEKMDIVGKIILSLIGTAWSVACVFVIPVLVMDEDTVNPFIILKRSALTLKKTWGESLIGYAGIQFGGGLIMLATFVSLGAAIALGVAFHILWLIPVALLLWLTAIVAYSYLISVASQVFRCALYLYASEGTIPEPYNQELIDLAWKTRQN